MAIAHVRDSGKRTIAGATSANYTWGTAPTANTHHVVCCANYWHQDWSNLTTVGVSDNYSNTWTKHVNKGLAVTGAYTANGDQTIISSSYVTSSGGSFQTTIVETGATAGGYAHWCLIQFSGGDSAGWFDKAGEDCHGPSTDAAPSCSSQNSQADGLVIAGCALDIDDRALNVGTPSGYTAIYTENDGWIPGGQTIYKITSALETSSATWTHDNHATDWGLASAIATFKAAAGAANIDRNPGVGAIATAGKATALALGVGMGLGALGLSGLAPAATVSQTIDGQLGAISLTGLTPSARLALSVTIPAGTLTVTGLAPSPSVAVLVSVPVAQLTLAGQAPVRSSVEIRGPPTAAVTLTGAAPAAQEAFLIEPPVGALTTTGSAPTPLAPKSVAVPAGTITLTGQAPTLVASTVPAVVQTVTPVNTGGSLAYVEVTLPSVVAGNQIVGLVTIVATGNRTWTFSDDQAGSYTSHDILLTRSSGIGYCLNATGGTTVVRATINATISSNWWVGAIEVTNAPVFDGGTNTVWEYSQEADGGIGDIHYAAEPIGRSISENAFIVTVGCLNSNATSVVAGPGYTTYLANGTAGPLWQYKITTTPLDHERGRWDSTGTDRGYYSGMLALRAPLAASPTLYPPENWHTITGRAAAVWAPVQFRADNFISTANGTVSSTPWTRSLPISAVNAGDLLVVIQTVTDLDATLSVSDDAGNSWSAHTAETNHSNGTHRYAIWTATNTSYQSSISVTCTVTDGNVSNHQWSLGHFTSPVGPVTIIDSDVKETVGVKTHTTNAVTSTANHQLSVGFIDLLGTGSAITQQDTTHWFTIPEAPTQGAICLQAVNDAASPTHQITTASNEGSVLLHLMLSGAPSSGTTISGVTGAVTLGGLAPAARLALVVGVPVGALVLAGTTAVVLVSRTVAVPVGAVVLAGEAPTRTSVEIRGPPVGAVTVTGLAPTLLVPNTISVPAGAISTTGLAVTLTGTVTIGVPAGTLTISGQTPARLEAQVAAPAAGTVVLSGTAPTRQVAHLVTPGAGSLVLTGAAPSLGGTAQVNPTTGALTLTGQAPSLIQAHLAIPGTGSLTLTGLAPTTGGAVFMPAQRGSITLTGLAPSLQRTYLVSPPAGTLTTTGAAPATPQALTVLPGVGQLTLSGQAPSLEGTVTVTPDVGALALTGTTSALGQGIAVPAGAVTLAGAAPTLQSAFVISPPAGALVLAGYDPTLVPLTYTDLLPDADVTDGFWVRSDTGTNVDLYSVLDEPVYDDGDYITTTAIDDECEIGLTAGSPPAVPGYTILRIRIPTGFTPVGTLTVTLREGATTTIQTWANQSVTAGSMLELPVTSPISNYTDLRVRLRTAA